MKKVNLFTVVFLLAVFILPLKVFAGYNWTETRPNGNSNGHWDTLASDADGSTLIAGMDQFAPIGQLAGHIYLSTDSGSTWTDIFPEGEAGWTMAGSNADGSNLMVGGFGFLYLSADSGNTWTWNETLPAGDWITADLSGDGYTIITGASGGRLYLSTDFGDTWNETRPAGDTDQPWQTVATSDDGNTLLAEAFGGRIYVSTDGGDHWAETQPAGDADKDWQVGVLSGDGSTMLAGIYGGRLYLSTDSGDTWNETQPNGDIDRSWGSGASNSDGSKLFVTFSESGLNRIYESDDSGSTWDIVTPVDLPNLQWSIASDADGSNVIAGGYGNRLYLGVPADSTSPTVSSLSPSDDSVDVSETTNLSLVFSEAVNVGTGNITIYKSNDDSEVEAIDVTSDQVTGGGTDAITIDPASDLAKDTEYYVQIDDTAFEDLAGNPYDGIADATSWNFTTVAPRHSTSVGSVGHSSSSAVTPAPSNSSVSCSTGQIYSTSTGEKCTTWTTPTTPTYNFGTILVKLGTTGLECKAWQQFLNDKTKANLALDGMCGPLTIAAAKAWQASVGLVPDGMLGPLSREKALE
jgi:hypothetical protein